MAGLLDELAWRGMLQDRTPGLAARLAEGRPISGYNGFDPSGPSLHVGHLVPVFGLLHFQRHGGRPVAVIGGATGMIGDPSGRSTERNLLDRETIAANALGIRTQLERFLDFAPGSGGATMVNNLDWLGPMTMLDFLRQIGKHFTVPYMLAKESVQKRLAGGLSYTEFSYMLLQAADFLHLYRTMGVELQMGGADQWGNITAGLELIRRVEGAGEGVELAHGLSYPLLTDEGGAKFGKTADGTSVWLDPARTSPYAFYQYWLNTPDATVGRNLRLFTLLARDEIEALEADHAQNPERRTAQRVLALDVTRRVHGPAEAARAVRISEVAFSDEPVQDPELLEALYQALDHFEFGPAELAGGALALGVASGLYPSKGEARRAIAQGGFSINARRVTAPDEPVPEPIGGRYLVLRHGRRRLRIGRRRG
ncbi:MAG: tyrosine--tRNA ligase [Chloroflexota bacterium]